MIKIENISIGGWEAAIRGMRNPKNSWDRSDSYQPAPVCEYWPPFVVGAADLKLMQTLARSGDDHGKFARMIIVAMDITAPLYWWKEFDTYKVGTVADSCSTMHKIHSKPIGQEDFSIDLQAMAVEDSKVWFSVLRELEELRRRYIDTGDKSAWRLLIQMLPCCYNQRRTVMLNYQVLHNQYRARKNHKLDEWREYCEIIAQLPYFSQIYIEEGEQAREVKDGQSEQAREARRIYDTLVEVWKSINREKKYHHKAVTIEDEKKFLRVIKSLLECEQKESGIITYTELKEKLRWLLPRTMPITQRNAEFENLLDELEARNILKRGIHCSSNGGKTAKIVEINPYIGGNATWK